MPNHQIAKSRFTLPHVQRLEWFVSNQNRLVSWPSPLDGGLLLVSKAKGIYKPADLEVALSVRCMLSSPYADEPVQHHTDGTWSWRYYQESQDPDDRDREYTNRGLMRAMEQQVPVGVLIQQSPKPESRYRVLGLGIPVSWESGYFTLESASLT